MLVADAVTGPARVVLMLFTNTNCVISILQYQNAAGTDFCRSYSISVSRSRPEAVGGFIVAAAVAKG
jgi:hypothetical protein